MPSNQEIESRRAELFTPERINTSAGLREAVAFNNEHPSVGHLSRIGDAIREIAGVDRDPQRYSRIETEMQSAFAQKDTTALQKAVADYATATAIDQRKVAAVRMDAGLYGGVFAERAPEGTSIATRYTTEALSEANRKAAEIGRRNGVENLNNFQDRNGNKYNSPNSATITQKADSALSATPDTPRQAMRTGPTSGYGQRRVLGMRPDDDGSIPMGAEPAPAARAAAPAPDAPAQAASAFAEQANRVIDRVTREQGAAAAADLRSSLPTTPEAAAKVLQSWRDPARTIDRIEALGGIADASPENFNGSVDYLRQPSARNNTTLLTNFLDGTDFEKRKAFNAASEQGPDAVKAHFNASRQYTNHISEDAIFNPEAPSRAPAVAATPDAPAPAAATPAPAQIAEAPAKTITPFGMDDHDLGFGTPGKAVHFPAYTSQADIEAFMKQHNIQLDTTKGTARGEWNRPVDANGQQTSTTIYVTEADAQRIAGGTISDRRITSGVPGKVYNLPPYTSQAEVEDFMKKNGIELDKTGATDRGQWNRHYDANGQQTSTAVYISDEDAARISPADKGVAAKPAAAATPAAPDAPAPAAPTPDVPRQAARTGPTSGYGQPRVLGMRPNDDGSMPMGAEPAPEARVAAPAPAAPAPDAPAPAAPAPATPDAPAPKVAATPDAPTAPAAQMPDAPSRAPAIDAANPMPSRSSGAMSGGAGVAMGAYALLNSDDKGDQALAAANIAAGAGEMGAAALNAGAKTASVLGKANIALTVADGAYQIYKEDGLGHKAQRAAGVAVTTGAGVATGAALAGGLTTAGGAAAVGGVAVAAAAAPVVVVAGAGLVAGHATNQLIDSARDFEKADNAFKATAENRNLTATAMQFKGGLQEAGIDKFDAANPDHQAKLGELMTAKQVELQKTVDSSGMSSSRWNPFGNSEKQGQLEDARQQLKVLDAAREEMNSSKPTPSQPAMAQNSTSPDASPKEPAVAEPKAPEQKADATPSQPAQASGEIASDGLAQAKDTAPNLSSPPSGSAPSPSEFAQFDSKIEGLNFGGMKEVASFDAAEKFEDTTASISEGLSGVSEGVSAGADNLAASVGDLSPPSIADIGSGIGESVGIA